MYVMRQIVKPDGFVSEISLHSGRPWAPVRSRRPAIRKGVVLCDPAVRAKCRRIVLLDGVGAVENLDPKGGDSKIPQLLCDDLEGCFRTGHPDRRCKLGSRVSEGRNSHCLA